MSNLYNFGDSYSGASAHFSKIKHFTTHIADNIGYSYIMCGANGSSNEQILNTIINHLDQFKNGDVVFINFSFFARGCWYDKKSNKVNSTNIFYNEVSSIKHFLLTKKFGMSQSERIVCLLNYYLEHTEDYARRLFTLIDSTLKYIESLGVKVFYIFVDNESYSDNLLKYGTNIKFKNGFAKWLAEHNFHNENEGHYSKGIQPILSNAILKKTNNLDKNIGRVIEIVTDDIDLNLMETPDKLLLLL
jgi:hypothetical protein